MAESNSLVVYDRAYYENYFGADARMRYERSEYWLAFFGGIADRIVTDIRPKSVLDAGCAMGMLVEALRDRGVDAYGVDISEYAVQQSRPDIRQYCWPASVVEPFPRHYDLVTCIETLEHLTAADAERAVANICAHTDDVLFSSTPTHYEEATHFNVQQPEYWAELFARHGLYRDVEYDASTYVSPWAARFRRATDPPARIAARYERVLWRLRSENRALRQAAVEQQNELSAAREGLQEAERQLTETGRRLEEAIAQGRELEQLRSTASWRLASRINRLASRTIPIGTRRGRLVRRVLRSKSGRG